MPERDMGGYWAYISSLSPHYLLIISLSSPHKYMRRYRTMSGEGSNKDGDSGFKAVLEYEARL